MNDKLYVDRIRQVVHTIRSYPFKVWGYGEGMALEALLMTDDQTGDKTGREFVSNLMTRWLKTHRQICYTDHVAPGVALLMLYERTGDAALLEQASSLARFFEELPRTRNGTRLHRPDHADFKNFVYVDCLDFDAPFLCLFARMTGQAHYFDLAADCLLGHAQVLWDSRFRLFSHLYDAGRDSVNGVFWGRGNGWASLGMLGTLELVPRDHKRFSEIADLFKAQMESIVHLQDAGGDWHTVLDRADTYREGSLTAMFYCVLRRGMRAGLLPISYTDAASRAWQALQARIDDSGVLMNVSMATPPGSTEDYARIPLGGIFPWGQGPLLQALLIGPPAGANHDKE
jgi:unsaturated rhamnogalacturonyl hydrolase